MDLILLVILIWVLFIVFPRQGKNVTRKGKYGAVFLNVVFLFERFDIIPLNSLTLMGTLVDFHFSP